MGGAAFPTHVKLNVPEGKHADVVILNGAECEPFLTADHRKMIEESERVADGLRLILRATGAQRGIVLSDLLRMEAGAVADLLPRITEPPLLAHEVARMDAADLMSCAVEISNFLLPRSLKPAG